MGSKYTITLVNILISSLAVDPLTINQARFNKGLEHSPSATDNCGPITELLVGRVVNLISLRFLIYQKGLNILCSCACSGNETKEHV